MKRWIPVILCLALLVGCGNKAGGGASSAPADSAAPSAAAPSPAPSATPASDVVEQNVAEQAARPVAVMVSNAYATTGRQWGLGSASLVLEGLTEGTASNWMLWFDSLEAVPKVGPVTQGKDLFWQIALPQNAILVQKGMNSYAENLLNVYGYQPLDALMLGVNSFDYDGSSTDALLTNEYCWYTSGEALGFGIDHYSMATQGMVPQWLPRAAAKPAAGAASLTVQFSDVQATQFKWENGAWAMYQKSGAPYIDANDGAPVAFANVVVLKADASVKDDKFTREYDLAGGSGLWLVEGSWQPITWKKGGAADSLTLYDADGKPLYLAEGKTYMAVWGGFAGQTLTLTDAAGAGIDHGL